MLTVEALDTLVHTVIIVLWTAFLLAFTAGAVCLHRHNAGLHRADAVAVDLGHQPAHAAPSRPSRLAVLLHQWRDVAAAHYLLTGGTI